MHDLISRQVAIDAMNTIGHIATMPDGDKCIRRSAVKYTLSMLPSAQPEPNWVPCSERMPDTGYYLVWMTFAPPENRIAVAKRCDGYWDIKTPISAWMPLPEPYNPDDFSRHMNPPED